MYRILRAEMVKKNISVKKLAMDIGITERSLRNKINGVTEFSLSEAKAIRKLVATDMDLEELFEKEVKTA